MEANKLCVTVVDEGGAENSFEFFFSFFDSFLSARHNFLFTEVHTVEMQDRHKIQYFDSSE